MPVSNTDVRINLEEDYLHVVARGEATAELSLDLWVQISQSLQETKCKYVLVENYFEIGSRVHLEAFQFAKQLKTLRIPLGTKFAVVCTEKKYKLNDFIANIMTTLNRYEGKVFLDLDDAKAWLVKDLKD